jgi:hypothetical protein
VELGEFRALQHAPRGIQAFEDRSNVGKRNGSEAVTRREEAGEFGHRRELVTDRFDASRRDALANALSAS